MAGDGGCCPCESGYLLVAPVSRSPVASSPSSGGSMLSWTRLLEGAFDAGGERGDAAGLVWGSGELESARTAATAAAAAIGALALCGIDVKFDWHQGALAPTVLDINPRPAGLMHSDLLLTDSSHREAGLAGGLWRHLSSLTAG